MTCWSRRTIILASLPPWVGWLRRALSPRGPCGNEPQLSSVYPAHDSALCGCLTGSLLHPLTVLLAIYILNIPLILTSCLGGTLPKSVGPKSDARKETLRMALKNWITCWSDGNKDPNAIDQWGHGNNLWPAVVSLEQRVFLLTSDEMGWCAGVRNALV